MATNVPGPIGEPAFEHDCDSCIFLGKWTFDSPRHDRHDDGQVFDYTERTTVDLYYCHSCEGEFGGSILARYQSEGRKYSSMPVNLLMRDQKRMTEQPSSNTPALLEGMRRAQTRELGTSHQLVCCPTCGEYVLDTRMVEHKRDYCD